MDLLHLGGLPDGGGAHATAGEPIAFPADDAEGVVVGADGFQSAGVGWIRRVFEKDHVDGIGLGFHFGGWKGLRGGDGGHFVGGAKEGVDGIAERLSEVAFDLRFEFRGVAGGGFEQDVAAGDEGGDAAEF